MSPFPRADYASLTRYTPDRRPVEVDLSDNTNLWGAHPAALARIRGASTDDLARYPELYADTLREAVAGRFGVDADCVATGAGSDDVLDSTYRAVFQPGAKLRYAAPTFSMIEPLARMNAIEATPVAWPDALADAGRLLDGDPDLVYVCRPNNPTGELVPAEWTERLLAQAGDDGPVVIVDEAYADFAGETMIPVAARTRRLIVARTTSKAYGLAGLRCGFAVATPDTALEIEKSRGPYKVSRLAIAATAAAIADDSGWMDRTVAECVENRTRLFGELGGRGAKPIESAANFILIAAPSGNAKTDALALRERDVAVRPFTDIPQHGESLRVTVGPWPLMERFLTAYDEAFE